MMGTNTNINSADYWDGVYRTEWESGQVTGGHYIRDYPPLHEAVVALVPESGRVLDIASGPGLLCARIKRARPQVEVTGVDFSHVTVARCRDRDAGLGIDYRVLDIRNELPTLEPSYDVVCMCEIVEHLDEPESVVADAMNVLKDGGRFILTCPHDDEIPDPEHVRRWGHDELFHLLAPYSETISFQHFAPPYYHVWALAYLTKHPSSFAGEIPKGNA